jgi:hypothetical protein
MTYSSWFKAPTHFKLLVLMQKFDTFGAATADSRVASPLDEVGSP